MYSDLRTTFETMGFETIPVNTKEPHINLKITFSEEYQTEHGYVIVTLDETSGIRYSREQFEHISYQIRDFLQSKRCMNYHFLYILISDDETAADRLFNDFQSYWRIIPSQAKLIAYENCDKLFCGLIKPIENYLISEYTTSMHSDKKTFDLTDEFNPRKIYVNLILISLNIIIFLLTDIFNWSIKGIPVEDIGSISWMEVFNMHEYYRVLTHMFLHSGIDHIFNNMIVLFFIGSYLEQYVGHLRYTCIYFLSGIIAGCTSMVYNMFQNNYVVSVGASGAIFGVMGGLLAVILIQQQQTHNIDMKRIAFMVFISLYGGFTSQSVDNAAHFGGFIGGLIITFIIKMITKAKDGKH